MRENVKSTLFLGIGMIVAFVLWTGLILSVDVQPLGQNGTNIGFATINTWFHSIAGVHMGIYNITDWMGLVPVFVMLSSAVCMCLCGILMKKLRWKWLNDYALPICMVIGMALAIPFTKLFGGEI